MSFKTTRTWGNFPLLWWEKNADGSTHYMIHSARGTLSEFMILADGRRMDILPRHARFSR